ncbi:MAG: hypothetical protein RDV48_09050 [Candidatus Eremiobacteraeota bacterium]|nr:hypothetical protein [Candidatus Eremiobacteraeota bacterium]
MARGKSSGNKMRAKYAKYRAMMKKRAQQAAQQAKKAPGVAQVQAGVPLDESRPIECDDDVFFSEEAHEDKRDRSAKGASVVTVWEEGIVAFEDFDEEAFDKEFGGEFEDGEESEVSEVSEQEEMNKILEGNYSNKEIMQFLKDRFMGGDKES